jgi:hypothetical protein
MKQIMGSVKQTHYEFINQCYTPFVYSGDIPRGFFTQCITDKDQTIIWDEVQKKYLIIDHLKEVPGLRVRLTLIKNLYKFIS